MPPQTLLFVATLLLVPHCNTIVAGAKVLMGYANPFRFGKCGRVACEIGKKIGINCAKTLGATLMVLTLGDLDLKQLRGTGASGRNVRD